MIIYNQAHTEKVEYLLDKLGIKGYSLWENVQGRGSKTGVPHLGTHAWPEINKSVLTIVDDDIVETVLEKVNKIDAINDEVGNKGICLGYIENSLRYFAEARKSLNLFFQIYYFKLIIIVNNQLRLPSITGGSFFFVGLSGTVICFPVISIFPRSTRINASPAFIRQKKRPSHKIIKTALY